MSRPRTVRQPGPPAPERRVAVPARGRDLAIAIPAGVPLLEGVRAGFAAAGFASGVAVLEDVALGPFAYVMPALSKDGANAAFYSDVFRPDGVTRLERGALTFGMRNGAPFFHGHALWTESSGRRSGGHLLPEETVLAAPASLRAFGLSGAAFVAAPDPETNFTLFGPVAAAPVEAEVPLRALAVRLRPNQDFADALLALAKAHGFGRARIAGGVGSTIGSAFADGRIVEPFATEVFVMDGRVGPDGAALDVGLVDFTGATAEGRLAPGENPVLMTFELVLVEEP